MFKAFILVLTILSFSLLAGDNIQNFSYGQVNWTKQLIIVTGSGAPGLNAKSPSQARLMAERAAKMDAYRNALEVIKGLKITSKLTFEKAMEGDKTIYTQIQGIIKGIKILNKKYYDDGGVDVILRIPLSGILPVEKYLSKKQPQIKSGKEKKYTALIVNLLNFKYDKVLLPKIISESGKIVYSADFVKKEKLKKNIMVKYYKNLDEAKKIAGDSPLIVNAKSLSSKDKSTVIISDADASLMLNGKINLDFLKEANVIFITK